MSFTVSFLHDSVNLLLSDSLHFEIAVSSSLFFIYLIKINLESIFN